MSGIRAVVVGVEQYNIGWRLDGPAADACRFVEFLHTRGVDRAQITLLVSALPDNQAQVKALGMPVRQPDRDTVSEVLRSELATDPADRLVFFWGGHGVVDGAGNRRLFYADATERDKRNLDFTDLLAGLMTTAFAGFADQLLVVDACQNLAGQLRYATTLPQDLLPRGAPAARREQHVLFAASPGQAAVNDTANKTGVFSREVLNLLAVPAAAWPPDAEALAGELDATFSRRRAEDPTTQTPTYLWCKSPRREGLVYAMPTAPPQTKPSVAGLEALIDLMLDSTELASVPNLHQIILLMPPGIRSSVRYTGVARTDILAWLLGGSDYTTGRAAIIGALRLGMANREALERLLAAFDQHWPPGGPA